MNIFLQHLIPKSKFILSFVFLQVFFFKWAVLKINGIKIFLLRSMEIPITLCTILYMSMQQRVTKLMKPHSFTLECYAMFHE
jgi:hypothetical protein